MATAPAETTRTRFILALLSLTIFVTITYDILPIGLLTGSASGGLILAASNSTVLMLASITIAAAVIGISLLHGWLPTDPRPSGWLPDPLGH